jgi:hypothetical protein
VVTTGEVREHAWCQVDLLKSAPIGDLALWPGSPVSNFWVFTSDLPFDTSLTPEQQAAQPGVTAVHTASTVSTVMDIPVPTKTTARYVVVQLDNSASLNLSQVTVRAAK